MKPAFLLAAFFSSFLGGSEALSLSKALPDFDHLRKSVIRIQAVSTKFDWFHPFVPGQDQVGVGSGFVVQTEPYPLFVTNEHVVNDAKQVTLQLLLYGEQQWEAEVVSVCPKFDIALLVLRKPAEFKKAMAEQNIDLQAVKLSSKVAPMGADVVALGFPLGQDTLKISKGNIAGNEEVDQNICIQSTAPISPGNSGGPLMNSEGTEVVGVNFAKATQGENINYVIPAWRVIQMVNKHKTDQPKIPESGSWQRLHVQVPQPDLTATEANEALYELGGCSHGVYNARIGQRSVFRNAEPPVSQGSFLTSVNGVKLDRFGMGLNAKYAADKVSYKDLFFMVDNFSEQVDFETCFKGKVIKHKVSMEWKPEYERGLRWVQEPSHTNFASDYEMFGDLSVMQMTVNHISMLVGSGQAGPARWLHPDNIAQPRLIVNYVRSGSYVADILPIGASITKVNGHAVSTLEDFRKHFEPEKGAHVWTVETDMGKVAALMFSQSLAAQVQKANTMGAAYLLTPGVKSAARNMGFVKEEGGASKKLPAGSKDAGSKTKKAGKKQSLLAAGEPAVGRIDTSGLSLTAAGPLLADKKMQVGRTTGASPEALFASYA